MTQWPSLVIIASLVGPTDCSGLNVKSLIQPSNRAFDIGQSISSKTFVRAIGDEIYLKIS